MAKQVLYRVAPRWSEIFIYAAIGLGPLGIAVSSSAQAAPARFAIDTSQVVRAMEAAFLPADVAEIKLAAPVTAAAANAPIAVESVSAIGPHAVRVRLVCHDHSECLPFFAVATFPEAIDATKLHGVKTSYAAGGQGAGAASQLSSSDARPKPAVESEAASVRAGAPATLELDEDRIHIRLEVICLQGGTAGNRVRVSSLDHKQIYTAQVVTPTLLKGEFQK